MAHRWPSPAPFIEKIAGGLAFLCHVSSNPSISSAVFPSSPVQVLIWSFKHWLALVAMPVWRSPWASLPAGHLSTLPAWTCPWDSRDYKMAWDCCWGRQSDCTRHVEGHGPFAWQWRRRILLLCLVWICIWRGRGTITIVAVCSKIFAAIAAHVVLRFFFNLIAMTWRHLFVLKGWSIVGRSHYPSPLQVNGALWSLSSWEEWIEGWTAAGRSSKRGCRRRARTFTSISVCWWSKAASAVGPTYLSSASRYCAPSWQSSLCLGFSKERAFSVPLRLPSKLSTHRDTHPPKHHSLYYLYYLQGDHGDAGAPGNFRKIIPCPFSTNNLVILKK